MEDRETGATLKPLVEAIFELRWELLQPDPQKPPWVDKNYKLAAGALFAKLQNDYPEHVQLPTSALPDEISAYVVQHQFKTEGVGWPLVQIGQGILTVNDIAGYAWKSFHPRVKNVIESLLEVYETMKGNLKVSTLALRYINAIDFDFENSNVLSYLRDKMGFVVELNPSVKAGFYGDNPNAIDLSLQFQTAQPANSDVKMRFFRGQKKDGSSGLMWETAVHARPDVVQSNVADMTSWTEKAHTLTRLLFDALTAGMWQQEEVDHHV